LQSKAVIGIIVAAVLVVAIIPVIYGYVQRTAAASLVVKFNRVELAELNIRETDTIAPLIRVKEGKANFDDALKTLQVLANDREKLVEEILTNTELKYVVYLDVSNPSGIDAIIDRAIAKVKVSNHELPQPIMLRKQLTIAAGSSQTLTIDNIAFTLKDVADAVGNTIHDDYRLTVDLDITSYYPTFLFGEVEIPSQVSLKTYLIPPKPTFSSESGFRTVAMEGQTSYDLTFTNTFDVSISGKLETGVIKDVNHCRILCTAVDSGPSVFLRNWIEEGGLGKYAKEAADYNEPVQVVNNFFRLQPHESKTVTIENPELGVKSQSVFAFRWEPDYLSIPYSVTTKVAYGQPETFTGTFEITGGDRLPVLNMPIEQLLLQGGYYVIRDFGYVGSHQFTTPVFQSVASGTPNNSDSSGRIVDVIVSPTKLFLSLYANKAAVKHGETVEFNGRLTDESGTGLVNQQIVLYRQEVIIPDSLGRAETDSNGYYRIEWLADYNKDADHTLTALTVLEGTSQYPRTQSDVVSVAIDYPRGEPKPGFHTITMDAQPDDASVNHGDIVTFYGEVIDSEGDPVVDQQLTLVELDENGLFADQLATGYTDNEGKFRIEWTADFGQVDWDGDAEFVVSHIMSEHYAHANSDQMKVRIVETPSTGSGDSDNEPIGGGQETKYKVIDDYVYLEPSSGFDFWFSVPAGATDANLRAIYEVQGGQFKVEFRLGADCTDLYDVDSCSTQYVREETKGNDRTISLEAGKTYVIQLWNTAWIDPIQVDADFEISYYD
jgi:hypothetical protein